MRKDKKMDITPTFRASMHVTIESMVEKKISSMDVADVEGFYVTLDDDQPNDLVLGAEEVDGIKYYLCQKGE